jgi:hypothetical protein
LTNKTNWYRETGNTGDKYTRDNKRHLEGVETSTRTGETDQGMTDILFILDQAQISVIRMKKRWRYKGSRSGGLVRIHQRVGNPPLPSVLLTNLQSLENKLDELRSRLSFQRDIKHNILCFTKS